MNPKLDNRRQETFVITDAPLEQFLTSDLYTVFIVFDLNNSQNIQNFVLWTFCNLLFPKSKLNFGKEPLYRLI